PLPFAVRDPVAEVMEAARVAVDHAAPVPDPGELALEVLEVVAPRTNQARHREGALDEGHAVQPAQVDDEPLRPIDLEGVCDVRRPDERAAQPRDDLAEGERVEALGPGPGHPLPEDRD